MGSEEVIQICQNNFFSFYLFWIVTRIPDLLFKRNVKIWEIKEKFDFYFDTLLYLTFNWSWSKQRHLFLLFCRFFNKRCLEFCRSSASMFEAWVGKCSQKQNSDLGHTQKCFGTIVQSKEKDWFFITDFCIRYHFRCDAMWFKTYDHTFLCVVMSLKENKQISRL